MLNFLLLSRFKEVYGILIELSMIKGFNFSKWGFIKVYKLLLYGVLHLLKYDMTAYEKIVANVYTYVCVPSG